VGPWVVMKVGGSLRGAHADVVVAAIARARAAGFAVVVVHGGGPRISERLRSAGINLPFVGGQRLTTVAAVEIVEQVLVGEVNPQLVSDLRALGINAVGVAGNDGVITAEPWPGLERTGRVREVRAERLTALVDEGEVPVLAPTAADTMGRVYNVNADAAAAAVSRALGAERIMFFTDVPGIYEDFASGRRLVDISSQRLAQLMASGCFQAGMIPKVRALCEALDDGVAMGFVLQGDALASAQAAVVHPFEAPWRDEYSTRVRAVETRWAG
jgi:acetylglutamate kinase